MPKTYNTIPSVSTGDVYTATAHNNIVTNVNNYRVAPACRVYRSTDWTYSGTYFEWNAEQYDTDGMFTASSTDITVQTAGIYLVALNYYYTCNATSTWMAALLYRNSVAVARTQAPAYGSTSGFIAVSTVISCDVGTVIRALHDPFGGSAHVVKGGTDYTTNNVSSLTATWLGQVS